ncbi:uncharacterized protein C8Q71DRAFT_330997 [Rhodofomes roseus]|uniref:Uncharacterized protein n=1 Tax=Rhodofomes roseus TaxID=34475 RepID=A0ABQ8KSC8_9APHY|nr:uncharacterized protein C8Q71DRAFT_330997 [Rhodofomes roseus]KAH9841469.1 hypothetical protein C8Q71DRAFT_330997 [Rhodofomes roseus]
MSKGGCTSAVHITYKVRRKASRLRLRELTIPPLHGYALLNISHSRPSPARTTPQPGSLGGSPWLCRLSDSGTEHQILPQELVDAVEEAVKEHRPTQDPKLTYIYTSACWVHGDNRKDVKTDTTHVTQPVELLHWRPALEQRIPGSTVLNGIVIRPSLSYGESASILAPLFNKAYEGKIECYGTPGDARTPDNWGGSLNRIRTNLGDSEGLGLMFVRTNGQISP